MQVVPTALFAGAHLDDEFLLGAGMASHLVQKGWRVVFKFESQGEKGKTGGLCRPEDLAAVRMEEERHSSQILGVDHLDIQNFGDGQLPQRMGLLVKDIKKVLMDERPSMVFTFPPSGCTGHEDHKAVQQATLAAVQEYKSEGAKVDLYYRVIPKDSYGIIEVENDPEYVASHRLHVVPYWGQIFGALMAHRTQRESMATIFPALTPGGGWWNLWPYEYFHAVALN